MDRRAEAEIEGVPARRVREITGLTLDPGHQAAKIRWLLRNFPGARGAAKFHHPVSYLFSRLTGEHICDHALASTTMLYSLEKRAYDDELLGYFDIDRSVLPEIAEATAPAGKLTAEGARLTGLPEGVTAAVGTGDDFSSPLGAGLVSPGRAVCVLGTAEVVGALHERPAVDQSGLVETHGYPGGGYFVENPGWLSGGTLAWLKNLLKLDDFGQLESLAAQAPPGSDGLTFIPALSGAMAPEWISSARGCYYGLTPAHDARHFARAALEGCAFAMCDVLSRLSEMEIANNSILLLAGGARSRLWAQIRADSAGIPAQLPERVDTSPIGAAMIAAVSAGAFNDLKSCAPLVDSITATIYPLKQNIEPYAEARARYRLLFDSLRPMF